MPVTVDEKAIIEEYFHHANSVLSGYEQSDKRRSNASSRVHSSYSNRDDGYYDTDLEEEADQQRARRTILEGTPCQKRYMKACRKLKTEPMNFVFWALNRATLHIGNRFPNEKENLAAAIGIAGNSTLVDIRLTHNTMSVKSVLYFCASVWENTNISFLELSGNKLCDKSLKILIDLVKHSQHLSALVLSDNGIRDMQGPLVAKLISENNCLMHLTLSYNELGDLTAANLADALKSDDKLRELDLSWNCIRTKGAQLLCEGLKRNTSLFMLSLRMNGIGTEGAGYFSRLLVENHILREVDLSQNRIYDTGYGYLAKMILRNQNLQRLSIGHNPVSTVGVKVFLQALLKSQNTALTNVDLDGIYITKEMEELVDSLKNLNPNMTLEVHGVVNKDTVTPYRTDDGTIKMHPLEIMRFYIEKTGSRLIDVFRMFDRQKTNEISKEDFVKGLQTMNVPLTPEQIKDLMSILDSTNSGSINFGEMVEGDKEARWRLRKRRERMRKMSMIKKEDFKDL